ncbi:MAG: hypothetical protein ACQEQ4_09750, partial [Fibrobacterota bacterium]
SEWELIQPCTEGESYEMSTITSDKSITAYFSAVPLDTFEVAISEGEQQGAQPFVLAPSLITAGEEALLNISLGSDPLGTKAEWEFALFDALGNKVFETAKKHYEGNNMQVRIPPFPAKTSGSFLALVKVYTDGTQLLYKTSLGVQRR